MDQGNKSVKLKGASRRLAADVVVCVECRKYTSYQSYTRGIAFQALQDKLWAVNFPKLHHDNGAKKGRRTGDRYKRTVRMFKSAGNHLETTGQTIPSWPRPTSWNAFSTTPRTRRISRDFRIPSAQSSIG